MKLGVAKNIIDHWSLVQIIDIKNVEIEFKKLEDNYNKLNTSFYNTTHGHVYAKEMYNYRYLLDFKFKEIHKKFEHIINIDNTNDRQKRGLINGLGTIWKSITGNLDQNDADKYDSAILELKTTQNKLKNIANSQISLTEKSLHIFNESVNKLQHNQILLESRIMQIEITMHKLEFQEANDYMFITLNAIFNQVIAAISIISEILENINNSILFSKLNILHSSIINKNELQLELQKIKSKLQMTKLPLEIQQTLDYYSIINIKSYIRNKQIVFILEIPLVEAYDYDYYKLYPLPIYNNLNFHVIIPKTNYLILNEKRYSLIQNLCKEINKMLFLCNEETTLSIHDQSPCEVKLITINNNINECTQINIHLSKTKIQKIYKNKWIVVTFKNIIIKTKCNNNEEKMVLSGTYIITVIKNCEVYIDNIILKSHEEDINSVKTINLPKIDYYQEISTERIISNLKPLNLDNLQLDDLNKINNEIEFTKKQIATINPQFHYNNISLYTIISYVVITIICLIMIKIYCNPNTSCLRNKIKIRSENKLEDPLRDIEIKN